MMHGSSKQRLKYSFVGSLLFHVLLIVLLALTGLFALNKNDDRILEVAVFGGGGGGGGGGHQQESAGSQTETKERAEDNAASKHTNIDDIVEKITKEYERNYQDFAPEQPAQDTRQAKQDQSTAAAAANGSGSGTGSGGGTGTGNGTGSGSGSGSGNGSGQGSGNGSGIGNGTDSPAVPPRFLSRQEPVYPSSARKAGIEGTTVVRMLINSDGEVDEVVVDGSSGVDELDEAAVAACYKWTFTPARNGAGQAIRCYTYVPISFKFK